MEHVLIQAHDFLEARKKIREAKKTNAEILFSGSNDDLNRKILEKEKINVLLVNLKGRKDKTKQVDSGFNQVLAKLARKNGVSLGINLDEVTNSESPKEKAEILARVRQNIRICIKNKVKIKFVSRQKKDAYDLTALGLVLGMPTWMANKKELF